jgi:hypothetical protein
MGGPNVVALPGNRIFANGAAGIAVICNRGGRGINTALDNQLVRLPLIFLFVIINKRFDYNNRNYIITLDLFSAKWQRVLG